MTPPSGAPDTAAGAEEIDPRRALWRRGSYEIVGDWIRSASTSVVDGLSAVRGTAEAGRWLDVATGTGAVAIEAATRGATVTAVDLTDELTAVASQRAGAAGVDVDFVLADVDEFLYRSEAVIYDTVTSSFGVIFAPDPARTATALCRVIAPDGWLGITAWEPQGALMVPDSIGALLGAAPDGPDWDVWADGIDDLLEASTLEVADQHVVSLVVMPLLARAKRRVGQQLASRAVVAETTLCVWLSTILLAGLGLNALFSWWWADPLAGLGIVYIAGREGIEHWRTEELEDCC